MPKFQTKWITPISNIEMEDQLSITADEYMEGYVAINLGMTTNDEYFVPVDNILMDFCAVRGFYAYLGQWFEGKE